MKYLKLYEEFLDHNLSIKKMKLPDAKEIFDKHKDEMEVYQGKIEKGTTNMPYDVNLYYVGEEFIGFIIYTENYFIFDENKKPRYSNDDTSSCNTIHINGFQIRDSIRNNKSNPRYGEIAIKDFIEYCEKKNYDAITLQAHNTGLIGYYKRFGFEEMGLEGNAMIKWLK